MADVQWLDPRNADTKRVEGTLSKWIKQYLPQYIPGQAYSGQLTAPISPQETQGLGWLQQYLDQPGYTSALPAANQNLTDTIQGKYDPRTSPFYQGLRDQYQIDMKDAQDELNRTLAGQRNFFSSENIEQNRELQNRGVSYLNNLLGGLYDKERDRQMQAIPLAKEISDYITKAPLQKATAATTIGALPRTLSQADLEAQYQEFKRQRTEQAQPVSAASTWSSESMAPLFTTTQSGSGSNWWNSWGSDVAGLYLKALMKM